MFSTVDLKRGAKRAALKTASFTGGTFPSLSLGLLKSLRIGYGPFHPSGGQTWRGGTPACVSIDFDVTRESRFEDNRAGTLALLLLAEKYKIPITWAVCGVAAENDMKSFGAIRESPGHELGVHTYAHLDATSVNAADFRDDVQRCIQALGIDTPRTFVFPWNREGHMEVIRSFGFRGFRGKKRAIGVPVTREGLWDIRPVYYIDQKSLGAEGLIKQFVDFCIESGGIFHLWSHPWSLVIDGKTGPMTDTLDSVFAHIADRRKENKLATLTLGAVASLMDSNERASGTSAGPEHQPDRGVK